MPEEDEDLAALAEITRQVVSQPAAVRLTAVAPPAPEATADPQLPVPSAAQHATTDDEAAADPELGQGGDDEHLTQATAIVAITVADRFRAYKRSRTRNGPQPTNAHLVFNTKNQADGRYADIVRAHQPRHDPALRFAPAGRQRVTTEARPTTQINFRLTYGQHREITEISEEAGARSVSALIDAILDDFLPAAPPRRGGTRSGGSGGPASG
jgi:hypothetical protein